MTKRAEGKTHEDDTKSTEVRRMESEGNDGSPSICDVCGAQLDENHAHKLPDGTVER